MNTIAGSARKPCAAATAIDPSSQPRVMIPPCWLAICVHPRERIPGDESLMRLAIKRYAAEGLGTEVYPESPPHLLRLLALLPDGMPCTAHLPRHLDLLDPADRRALAALAEAGGKRLRAVIIHDQPEFLPGLEKVAAAATDLRRRFSEVGAGQLPVHIEYAAFLEPEVFAALCARLPADSNTGVCLDISHIGLFAVREAFGLRCPGIDAFRPETWPEDPALEQALAEALPLALPRLLYLVRAAAQAGIPVHFHLHDGHPWSRVSPYGVSDHVGFLAPIPVRGIGRRESTAPGIFGLEGLARLFREVKTLFRDRPPSFMFEIHPTEGRLPLGPWADLFSHWSDLANAERMHFWVDQVIRNADRVRALWEEATPEP